MSHSKDYRDGRWDRNMSHERSAPSGRSMPDHRSPLNENQHWNREAEGQHRRAMSDSRWQASAHDEWSPMPYAGAQPLPRYKEFIGKGPKGYSRSDALIQEDVSQRLSHGYLDASEIEVSVKDGEVTLQGMVNSKHDRRLAEDLVEECFGVKDVDNRLKVPRSRASHTDEHTAAGSNQDGRDSAGAVNRSSAPSSASGRVLPS